MANNPAQKRSPLSSLERGRSLLRSDLWCPGLRRTSYRNGRGIASGLIVHIITRKRLNEFAEEHSDARSALAHWYTIMRKSRFLNFVQLRETFPHADQVGKFTVFNIGGNKVRLIAALHYK